MKKRFIYIAVIFCWQPLFCQKTSVLTLSEYLTYIKRYHPIVKQANLLINESEAKLLKVRGAFDPKIEVDYDKKEFKETEYFDKLNAAFKIPTWYGIELKGSFEENSGVFLNPESKVPDDGLYSVGVSISLARDLLINKRMATLKQANLYKKQAKADNKLLVNEILYNAIKAYFNWIKTYQEKQVHSEFLNNAKLRYDGIRKSFELGEKPAIDTTEARIAYNNRRLNLEKTSLNYLKASLELSNHLWINNIPVEVTDSIFPDNQTIHFVDRALRLEGVINSNENNLTTHPKIESLDLKLQSLRIEKRLKKNNLLPKMDLQYNFISKTPEFINTLNTSNYKTRLSISFPLFLRKERADLKLANYKYQAVEFEKQAIELSLKNKLTTIQQEITSYENQISITSDIVADYHILLKGEERKFEMGESSLFLINTREAKLIDNKLKSIEMVNLLLQAKGKLFNALALN